MNGPEAIKHSLVFLLLFTAARTDIREKRIPNRLTGMALGVRLLLYMVGGKLLGKEEFIITEMQLAGTAVLLSGLTLFAICSHHGLGFGDVKLLGAASLYLGTDRALACLFYGLLPAAAAGMGFVCTGRISRKQGISLAPFFLFGYVLTFLTY